MAFIGDWIHDIESSIPRIADFNTLLDDDFGYGIHPMDLLRPRHSTLHPRRQRGWLTSVSPYDRNQLASRYANRRRGDKQTSDALMPHLGKDGFQVSIDVSQFKPNELVVKTVDNVVFVEGKHEEREDEHGLIQRHFVRKYTLPKDYDPKDVVSTISSDGVLTVKAPPPPGNAIKQNERVIQIQQTGPAHLSIKAPTDGAAAASDGSAAATAAANGAKNKMETSK